MFSQWCVVRKACEIVSVYCLLWFTRPHFQFACRNMLNTWSALWQPCRSVLSVVCPSTSQAQPHGGTCEDPTHVGGREEYRAPHAFRVREVAERNCTAVGSVSFIDKPIACSEEDSSGCWSAAGSDGEEHRSHGDDLGADGGCGQRQRRSHAAHVDAMLSLEGQCMHCVECPSCLWLSLSQLASEAYLDTQ